MGEASRGPQALAGATCRALELAQDAPLAAVVRRGCESLWDALYLGDHDLLVEEVRWLLGRVELAVAGVDPVTMAKALQIDLDRLVGAGVARRFVRAVEATLTSAGPGEQAAGAGDDQQAAGAQQPVGQAPGYAERLLLSDLDGARQILLEEPGDFLAVMLGVIEPAHELIARRAAAGAIHPDRLAIAVDAAARTLAWLRDRRPEVPFDGRSVTGVLVGGSRHPAPEDAERRAAGVALRLVLDVLEDQGWATEDLEPGTPEQLARAIRSGSADVVVVRAETASDVLEVRSLVDGLRADPVTVEIPVLLTGRPFVVSMGLVRLVGADGAARTAAEVVSRCAEFIDTNGPLGAADPRATGGAAAGPHAPGTPAQAPVALTDLGGLLTRLADRHDRVQVLWKSYGAPLWVHSDASALGAAVEGFAVAALGRDDAGVSVRVGIARGRVHLDLVAEIHQLPSGGADADPAAPVQAPGRPPRPEDPPDPGVAWEQRLRRAVEAAPLLADSGTVLFGSSTELIVRLALPMAPTPDQG